MKLTKTLSAAIAATTIVGAIGFAVAQTSDTTAAPTPAPETMAPANTASPDTAPAVTPAAPMPDAAAPAPEATAPANSDLSTSTEPAAKPDRN